MLLSLLHCHPAALSSASVLIPGPGFLCVSFPLSVSLLAVNSRFAIVCNYYMLSLRMKELGVNIHFTHVIPGMMEVPARLCCIFLLEQLNRKRSLILTFFQGALMCFLSLLLPSGTASPNLPLHLPDANPGLPASSNPCLLPPAPIQPTKHLGS